MDKRGSQVDTTEPIVPMVGANFDVLVHCQSMGCAENLRGWQYALSRAWAGGLLD